jgi:flavin reductase (DIM6/NTAB) family NADH-FMN oxidoreductase RutF
VKRADPLFTDLSRQKFRDYFQPSRIVLCVLPARGTESGFNVITLSFNMHCSYKPSMMAIAVQDVNQSYDLIRSSSEFVLAVPGESMAQAAMACGVKSVKSVDKVKELGLELIAGQKIAVPGLLRAIANVEMRKRAEIESGDHVLVVGEVLRFAVNRENRERPLLSIGRNASGFDVLSREGMHRLAVVSGTQVAADRDAIS